MSRSRLMLIGLCFAITACTADDNGAVTPPLPPAIAAPAAAPSVPDADRDRNERHARRIAAALRDPDFRAAVHRALSESRFKEGRLDVQAFLTGNGGAERRRVAALAGEAEVVVSRDLDEGASLELYFPVPEHRRRWRGGTDLIVATAERDGEAPLAFDLMGRRLRLDPDTPPRIPVLMVGRSEIRFDGGPSALSCIMDCGGGGGGGGAGGAPPGSSGLYLTRTQFTGTFESWFKGNPEFEVHVLGQAGVTTKLQTYQCAGEHAGGAYAFDQNGTTWSGSVLLFSQAQLDQYRAIHPGQNLRVLVLEDDDTACEIKVDSARVSRALGQLNAAHGGLTGGSDSVLTLQRVFKAATALSTVYNAIANIFKTNDDLVGNAIEDAVAAAGFFSGANWVVKGENLVTQGAMRLEMR